MPIIGEVWKVVPGWPAYEVSNRGQVRSFWTRKGAKGRKGQVVRGDKPRLLKPQIGGGHLIVTLGAGASGTQVSFGVAHLVLMTFVRLPKPGEVARHYHDPDHYNCKVSNLRWGTRQDNVDDVFRHHGVHFNAGRKHTSEARAKMSKSHQLRLYGAETLCG